MKRERKKLQNERKEMEIQVQALKEASLKRRADLESQETKRKESLSSLPWQSVGKELSTILKSLSCRYN